MSRTQSGERGEKPFGAGRRQIPAMRPAGVTDRNDPAYAPGRERARMVNRTLVSLVDDDESVRESLPELLRSFGFEVEAFASAESFLASAVPEQTGCLLLDVAMPGMSGPALQLEMLNRKMRIPIVFITSHADDAVRSKVLELGAVAYLLKPFSEAAILDAVKMALSTS